MFFLVGLWVLYTVQLLLGRPSVVLTCAGISCPRAARVVTAQGVISTEGDQFGDDALHFTKELCLQREVD